MKRSKKWWMLALILVLCAAGAWALFGGRKNREIKVLATATVERGAVRKVLEATGIVKAQVGAQVK
ncbi:MAG: efflux transporter periplasmic adaptor subunit, partial [Desulfovibrionaceae bacterium]